MKKIRLMALLSAILVFFCAVLYLPVLERQEKTQEVATTQVAVVVAKQSILPYTILTEDMLEYRNYTEADVSDTWSQTLEEVVGKSCMTDIFAGEPITSIRLGETDELNMGLAARLADGMRAVSVEVDVKQGVAGTIKVGNYVDLIVVYKVEDQGEGQLPTGAILDNAGNAANTQIVWDNLGQYFSYTVMQNIKVVALDEVFLKPINDVPDGSSYGSVTLEVKPEQAAKIALMDGGEGEIRLSLRPQWDDGVIHNPRQNLLESYIN